MPSREAWADGYYAQASADWDMFRELRLRDDVPVCYALHYLQMATEKLAKAYRFRDTTTAAESLLTSHVGFGSFLTSFLHSQRIHQAFRNRSAQLSVVRRGCGQLARLVEQLAPAVGGTARPENAEYPWADGADVAAPVHYSFPSLDLRQNPHARVFLNFVQASFEEYAGSDVAPG